MIKAYIPAPLPSGRKPLFLNAMSKDDSRLYQSIPFHEFDGIIERVDSPEAADYVIAPQEYSALARNPAYLASCLKIARDVHKRLIVSAIRDENSPVRIPGAIILRPGGYRSMLLPNEVVVPPYVEDIGAIHGMRPIPKGKAPSIGFVGKAGFAGLAERIRYVMRNYALYRAAKREGVYFRRRCLSALRRDARIDLHEIVRGSFSANRKTIEVSPEQARREYIENMRSCLFTLAPRGDGNFSFRFYEALSAGRIPVLIETDNALPLKDRIRYDEFIVRVPWRRIAQLGDIVYEFWSSHSDEELREMQQKARSAFETHLYAPRFYREIFTPAFLSAVPDIGA